VAQVLGRSERQVWYLLTRAREGRVTELIRAGRGRELVNESDERLWWRMLKVAREKYQGVTDRHL